MTEIRPNILFLMTDQHNARCFGYSGNPDVKTPNIDSLAEKGVSFRNAFCQNGVCVPSRVSYHTGMYCNAHGVYGSETVPVPEKLLSLPAYLKQHGYQTALIGKEHLPGWHTVGYDYKRMCYCSDGGALRNVHYYQYLKKHGLQRYYDDLGDVMNYCMSDDTLPVEHSLEVWTANESIDYLKQKSDDTPFFMHVSFERPHPPLTVPKGTETLYDPMAITLPENDREVVKEEPIFFNRNIEMDWCKSVTGEARLRQGLANYYGLITLIDQQIGRLIDALKQQGQYEKTLIIFCSDHGDYAGEYSKMAKGFNYDCIHRVPYIWHWPGGGFHTDGEKTGLVQAIDLFPTVCDLLSLDIPDRVQGQVLSELLRSDNDSEQEAVFWEFVGVKTIRTATHKLNYCFNGETVAELYDLVRDPYEYDNVYDDSDYAAVRDDLKDRLLNWLISSQQPPNLPNDHERLPPTRFFDPYDFKGPTYRSQNPID